MFKNWLAFTESIIINDNGTEAALSNVPSPNLIKEFNYQSPDLWSSFFIAPYQAKRLGYVSISNNPTHVGITKTTPIEQGKGVDIAFLKALTNNLTAAKLIPVPYKEGESNWSHMINDPQIKTQFGAAAEKDAKTPTVPNIQTSSSHMQQITKSMSVSKASGSWSYFIKTNDVNRIVSSILSIMEKSMKPLLDHDLVEFYEIVDRMSMKREKVVYSRTGQQSKDDFHSQWEKGIAYLKYLAETMLKNHPSAQKLVMNHINQVGVKVSGGGENPKNKINPAANKVNLDDLTKLVNQSYAEDIVLLFFLRALKKDNNHLYQIMDKVASDNNPQVSLYYASMLLDNKTEMMFNNIDAHLGDALELFKSNVQPLVPNEFNSFKKEYEDAVNDWLNNHKDALEPREVKYLKKLSEYINIELADQIHTLHGHVEKQEEESKKKRLEAIERNKFIINEGSYKYLVLKEGQSVWKDIPNKYIGTGWGNRGDDIDLEEFCSNEIVDNEDVIHAAHEKASEDAYENAETRPSETYGEDKDDVLSDIDYYADDFIEEEELEVPEGVSTEDFIKNKHYDTFVKWRIDQLKEKEEKESWRYEPEPDESDIYKYMAEFSVEIAFEKYGLVTLEGLERNDIKVMLNSTFEPQLMTILKKTIQITRGTKDPEFNEPLLKTSNKITLSYRDKDKDKVMTVNQFI